MPTIVAAAIQSDDGIVHSVPLPGRHHDVIRLMVEEGYPTPIGGVQGFVTSEWRFVDRIDGARIAIAANQIAALRWPPNLYSEDLW